MTLLSLVDKLIGYIVQNKEVEEMSDKISQEYREQIQHLNTYHPYHGGMNTNFKESPFSGKILDLKQNKLLATTYFFNLLVDKDFDKTEAIVIVPSHDPSKISSLIPLATLLANRNGWVNATRCIKRTKKITKLADGGERSKAIHLSSLIVQDKDLIKDKNILVFDDVTTSGNSLYAVMELLLQAGAKSVWAYALGKTQ